MIFKSDALNMTVLLANGILSSPRCMKRYKMNEFIIHNVLSDSFCLVLGLIDNAGESIDGVDKVKDKFKVLNRRKEP